MTDEICWIDLQLIDLPARGRQHDPVKIAELARDMSKNGQLQDIIVTPKAEGRFELVAGRGRFLAAQMLKWEKAQCLVKEKLSEKDKYLIMISENDEREDVSPVDRGLSYIWAMEAGGMSQYDLAETIGKTNVHVSQYVSAAGLPEQVRGVLNRFNIGIAHINQIGRLPTPEAQLAMAEKCHKQDLSVKQLEILVKKALDTASLPGHAQSGDESAPANQAVTGFKITKSAAGVKVSGTFPATVTQTELAKALEDAFQKWQGKDTQTKPVAEPSNNIEVSFGVNPDTGVKAVLSEAELNAMKERHKKMLAEYRDLLKTEEGKVILKQIAKSSGFESPEEYLAKTEELLKNQGLIE